MVTILSHLAISLEKANCAVATVKVTITKTDTLEGSTTCELAFQKHRIANK